MKGLVIKSPWIEKILAGEKSWELRTRPVQLRGRIALIKGGSGTIVGTAEIADCIPASRDLLAREQAKHRVPADQIDQYIGRPGSGKQAYAWALANVQRFEPTVPYRHPSGAVIWVALSPDNCDGYARLGQQPPVVHASPSKADRIVAVKPDPTAAEVPSQPPRATLRPAEHADSIVVEISQGNINNNHIYITDLLTRRGFLPQDVIGSPSRAGGHGRPVTLDVQGLADPVTTDVPLGADGKPRKFFRERKWVAEFFARHRIEPGEKVRFTKVAERHFRVTPERS